MASEIIPAGEVLIDGPTTPIEFTFRGKRFRIHAVLSRWCESGGWWNRVSDGKYRPDDQARALWRVEAAPIGALTTFQLERDEATRAVHDALPILVGARLVHVIAVNPSGGMAGHGDVPGADICLHLSRHGVNAVCEHIRSEDLKIGEMLLSRAADEDVDLLVMGAYGRSRLRELVMGGATRHLLGHMTVPVLMSH